MPKGKQQDVEEIRKWETDKVLIRVIPRYCKGCEICVKLCPVQVLGLELFKVKATDADKCIGCMQCELHCPDCAISVEKKENSQ